MNVLSINNSDAVGGAGVVGRWLHERLLAAGVDSHMLVAVRSSSSERIARVPGGMWHDRWLGDVTRKIGLNYLAIRSKRLRRHPFFRDADLLQFHNLHGDYFNYRALPALTADKPGVLTLHDVWAMTGHCSVSLGCERFTTGCGRCPHKDIYPSIGLDATRVEWLLKDGAYSHSNLTVVCPSTWMAHNARRGMLGRFPIHHIPNGLDTELFRPMDQDWCRRVLDLPPAKKVLMSAACNLHDVLKGGDLMVAALSALPASLKRDVVLLSFGDGAQAMSEKTGVRARGLGYVADDRVKAIAYGAADVFVSPSRSENFPTVVLEAMACGVPCVAFNVGGIPDLVRPGATGLLADPEDAGDLSRRVVQILEDDTARRSMARACRERAVAEYDLGLTAGRYIDLYRQVLAAHAAPRVAQRSSPDQSAAREMARGWTAAARGEG